METRPQPAHHPDGEFLAAYAAGSIVGARALIAAAHLTYCAACRRKVAAMETVGGELLEREPGVATAVEAIPEPQELSSLPLSPPAYDDFEYAPRPLRELLRDGAGQWINVWFGVRELPIDGFPSARLLWIPAGRRMPRHDHYGEELTLVLRGSFSDTSGRYAAGDLQIGEPGLDHQPHAGSEGPCVCLVVEDGGLKLSGWLGRLVAWGGGPRSGRAAA